jgi:hypothetical protein
VHIAAGDPIQLQGAAAGIARASCWGSCIAAALKATATAATRGQAWPKRQPKQPDRYDPAKQALPPAPGSLIRLPEGKEGCKQACNLGSLEGTSQLRGELAGPSSCYRWTQQTVKQRAML